MDSNYDDNDLDFGVMPSFIPANAPEVKPEVVDSHEAYNAALKRVTRQDWSQDEAREYLNDLLARMDRVWDKGPSNEYTNVMTAALDNGFIEFADADKQMAALIQEFRRDLQQNQLNEAQSEAEASPQVANEARVDEPVLNAAAPEPQDVVSPAEDIQAALRAAVKEVEQERKVQASQEAPDAPTPEDLATLAQQGVMPAGAMGSMPAQQVPQAVTSAPFSNTVSEGQEAARSGMHTLADGGLGVIGGLSSLVGVVGRGVGRAARGLAQDLEARSKKATAVAPSVSVLPKISEYRVGQTEKMANSYEEAQREFWQSGRLPEVRRAIEEHARTTGVSVPDVMAKMVPGGELEGLRTDFVEAVNESPKAQESKVAMGKALDGWLRQYGRGSEELLNPDSDGSPEHQELRQRFEGTKQKMEELVSENPIFAGDELSHAEKFRQAIERIAQKLEQMVRSIVDLVRGNSPKQEAQQERGYEP